MNWQTVLLADVAPTPWRNGGGVTRELLAWPTPDNWIWRLSVAEVSESGPFSHFEGVQRWFAVLDGAGVSLSMGGQTHALDGRSAPLCFDGARPVDCQLRDGPTQDFNLMLRSGQASAQMTRVHGDLQILLDTPKIIAIYPIDTWARAEFDQTSLVVAADSLVWRPLPAGATVRLVSENALCMEVALCR